MRIHLAFILAAGLSAVAAPAPAEPGGAWLEFRFTAPGVDGHGPRHGKGGVILYFDDDADAPAYYDRRRDHRYERRRHERYAPEGYYGPARRDRSHGLRDDRRFLGHTPREIHRELRRRGFRHIEIDPDDDEFEIEARRRGRDWEMEVSRRSGRVTEVEIDD